MANIASENGTLIHPTWPCLKNEKIGKGETINQWIPAKSCGYHPTNTYKYASKHKGLTSVVSRSFCVSKIRRNTAVWSKQRWSIRTHNCEAAWSLQRPKDSGFSHWTWWGDMVYFTTSVVGQDIWWFIQTFDQKYIMPLNVWINHHFHWLLDDRIMIIGS